MLTTNQKSIMSDAMLAVANTEPTDSGILESLKNPFGSYLGNIVGTGQSTASVRVLYVQIFAKGDYADSKDFKQFMSAAKIVADPDRWAGYGLDARWAALSEEEQGPGEVSLALENLGLPAPSKWGEWLGSLGSTVKWVLFGVVAVLLLVTVNRFR